MGSITVSARGSDFALVVPQLAFNEAGLDPKAEYELFRVKRGIWVLIAKEKEKPKENPLDAEIFKMVREKSLQERVEGKFEKMLSEEELSRFKEILKEGRIVAFKLSPKYKKAVYKTKEEVESPKKTPGKKESEFAEAREKPFEEYSLEEDGFLVCKSMQGAKELSEQLKEDIEKGEIRGIKSFEGVFYITEDVLYQKYRSKALSAIKAEKGISSEKLARLLGISTLLAKIICELLKEDSEIIEKRKDSFQAI